MMLRNRSFGVKLILALVLIVFVAVAAVAIPVNLSVARQFEDYVSVGMRPRMGTLAPLLAEYYAARGDWSGVGDVLMENARPEMGPRRGMTGMRGDDNMHLVLTNAQGVVVGDTSGRYQGRRLSRTVLGKALAIQLGGEVVGYLLTGSGSREEEFQGRLVTSILWAGGLAVALAILLGLILTRTLVRPLNVVRDAAQRIGAGDLAYRVPVASRDEIGDLARQFNEMASALERDELLRRQMMADIAHELRTPLSVIRGHVEALQDGVFALSPENIAPIHDQSLLLGRLVDDLRDLALAEAGRLPLERAEVDLAGLVRRVVGAFQPRAREKGLTLSAETPRDLPPAYADAQRLEQVLGNLLSNAVQHTPAGGEVRVRAWQEGQELAFIVADTGAGIAPEDLPYIFERFYRADKARSRAEGSTGLGLSIARRLVEAHGGRIAVESTPGKGATFTVRLPLYAAKPDGR
jgi:signal transduction histidine kinase